MTLNYATEEFVLLTDIAPDVTVDMRYYSENNFVGARIDGYDEPCAILTKKAAQALRQVSDAVMAMGYRLKVYDAYRPQSAVNCFCSWASDRGTQKNKAIYYPDIEKSCIISDGYINPRSEHSRGSAVDLTLTDLEGNELDMGGIFDFFGELSHPDYLGISAEQAKNRRVLSDAMTSHGFRTIDTEWWHFSLTDEPYPDTYFDFTVSTRSLIK